jgi:hypothetical protein
MSKDWEPLEKYLNRSTEGRKCSLEQLHTVSKLGHDLKDSKETHGELVIP